MIIEEESGWVNAEDWDNTKLIVISETVPQQLTHAFRALSKDVLQIKLAAGQLVQGVSIANISFRELYDVHADIIPERLDNSVPSHKHEGHVAFQHTPRKARR